MKKSIIQSNARKTRLPREEWDTAFKVMHQKHDDRLVDFQTTPAKKSAHDAEKKLEEVTLSFDGKRILFLFENGEGYSIPRNHLPGDDGTPVTTIQLFDHRYAAAVTQASGSSYDLPWNSIKHYARGGGQKKVPFGLLLRKAREEKGYSQDKLARAAKISRMQLIRLEKGTSQPTLDTLLHLAEVLGTSPQDLSRIPFGIH